MAYRPSAETRAKISASLRGNKNRNGGLDPQVARERQRLRQRAYYHTHKERYRVHDKAWKVAHKKECDAQHKIWYARNRETILLKSKDLALRKKYGMTLSDFHSLLEHQGGACSVCRRSIVGKHDTHVDHDHVTGAVRGLLCNACNVGLGMLGDSPVVCRLAAEYLEKNNL